MVTDMNGTCDLTAADRLLPARRICILAGLTSLGLLAGCGKGPPAEFTPRDSTSQLIPVARKAVQQVMLENFGTPQSFVGWERLPVNYGGVRADVAGDAGGLLKLTLADPKLADQLHPRQSVLWLSGAEAGKPTGQTVSKFDPKTMELALSGGPMPAAGDKLMIGFGSQLQLGRTVYMKNCTHCHGVTGDGQGPTAKYLYPRPRDYRLGIFKFTSTLPSERASRDDLLRIVKNGIPGTYMPSFLLMKDDEAAAVVEYVRWLAMRGELEKKLGDELSDFNEPSIRSEARQAQEEYAAAVKRKEKPEKPLTESQLLAKQKETFETEYAKNEFPGVIDETADALAETWKNADVPDSLIVPQLARVEDTPESRLRGRVLYMSNRTKCYTCHGPLGRGDGGAAEDFWPIPGSQPPKNYPQRGLHDQWGHRLQPRDLTRGQYRGGRRPLDLYRRVFAGIKGTPMPAFGGTVLKDAEIWDLVNYVMSIPFETQPLVSPHTPEMAAAAPPAGHDHSKDR